MSLQYGIKEVLNLQFLDITTTTPTPLFYIDYAESTEIDNTGTRIPLAGGQGNYQLMAFDHSKLSIMKLKVPLVDLNLVAQLSGDTLSTAAQNLFIREVLTVSATNTVTLTQTPLNNSLSLYQLAGSRDNGTQLTVGTPASTQNAYSVTGTTVTLNATSNPQGSQVTAWYQYASPNTTTKFSMTANKFVKPMKIIGDGLGRDQVTNSDKASKITVYNAKFRPNFNLVLSSTAPVTLDLELDMYAVPQNGNMVYYDVVFLT